MRGKIYFFDVLYQYVVELWWVTYIWYIRFLIGWTPSFSLLVVIFLIFYIDFQDYWLRVGTNFGCNKTQAIYRPAKRTTASQIGQW